MRLVAIILLSLLALGAAVARADQTTGSRSSQLAPLPTWTGFYAGVNAGGLWNSPNATAVDWSRLTLPGNFANATAFLSIPQPNFAWSNKAGFIGGGQVGYNWQITDRIVVGVETDFQGVTGGGSNWNSGWVAAPSGHGPSSIGTVRGRAGYLVAPNLQVYGTGGLAYGAGN
jgi:outer membrane immunogenic protein